MKIVLTRGDRLELNRYGLIELTGFGVGRREGVHQVGVLSVVQLDGPLREPHRSPAVPDLWVAGGGQTPGELVQLRNVQCSKSTPEEMVAALQGDWRPEHLFVLRQSLETYRHLLEQMRGCDLAVQEALTEVILPVEEEPGELAPPNPPASPKPRQKKRFHQRRAGTGLRRDLSGELVRICGVDLTQVTGLNVLGVLIIISETGLDMRRWCDSKAFSSWLGLCPGNKISGGKVLSSRTAHVVNRVAILLRTVAPAVGMSDPWLGSFHRRMRAGLGPAGANTATAHKLATLIYHLLRFKEGYIAVDRLFYEEKIRGKRLVRLRKQAQELGFELIQKNQIHSQAV